MAKKKTVLRAVDDVEEDVGLPVEAVDGPEEGADDAEEGVEIPAEALDSNSPEAIAAATASEHAGRTRRGRAGIQAFAP